MAQMTLKALSTDQVSIFKIANRKGYAAVCLKNLTEGATPEEAFERMVKAVKRTGYELVGNVPPPEV